MPAQNETKKSYNPTIVGFVLDDRFGLKDETGGRIPGTAFKSYTLNSESFTAIQQHVTIGSTLLLRKSKAKNSQGSEQYFLEVLPATEGNKRPQRAKAVATDDSI